MELIFEKSVKNRRGYRPPRCDVPAGGKIADQYCRKAEAQWPQVSELDAVRHFTRLSRMNFSIDTNFYPLGSCTMKYNPRFTEALSQLPGFSDLHPLLAQLPGGEKLTQGALQVLYDMERLLCEMTGMDAFTMQPLAGAHGELTGVMMVAAYHRGRGNQKKYILVPDSAHGTNPATAAIAGYTTVTIPTGKNGDMDLKELEKNLNREVAGMMLTCPDTLGIFNSHIDRITEMVHAVDGLMYYDGANFNALLGRCRPGDIGFDVMHLNTHKTFTTPHGGGGPGSGPVGVKEKLIPYLPISRVVRRRDHLALDYNFPDSIGYIAPFYGHFALLVRAYAYILLLGKEGLVETSNHAVLNANYILSRLKEYYDLPFNRTCMHECVFSAARQAERGVHAIDVAKYLIDQGIHPPTVYFPLTVKEAIMIEPTECESKETMDAFVEQMIRIDELSEKNPGIFKMCPQTTPVSRPDEVKAARDLNTNYFLKDGEQKETKKNADARAPQNV